MAINRRFDHTQRVVWTTMADVVTADEVREHFKLVQAAGAAGWPEVIDGRAAAVGFSTRELAKVAAAGRQIFRGSTLGPRAMIVHGMIHFGIARLFASFASSWVQLSVFDNPEAAYQWIESVTQQV